MNQEELITSFVGRSGRQGDPGESRFYIGPDDDLMKIFGGDMITRVYNTLWSSRRFTKNKTISNKAGTSKKSRRKKPAPGPFSIIGYAPCGAGAPAGAA